MTVADTILIIVVMSATSIGLLLLGFVWEQARPALNETLSMSSPGGTLNAGSALALTQTSLVMDMQDSIFAFVFFGCLLCVLVSSFFLNTHPIFFIISFIGLIFMVVILSILGVVYDEFSTSSQIVATASRYPLMNMIWGNIEVIGLLFGAFVVIVLFVQVRGRSNANAYAA